MSFDLISLGIGYVAATLFPVPFLAGVIYKTWAKVFGFVKTEETKLGVANNVVVTDVNKVLATAKTSNT